MQTPSVSSAPAPRPPLLPHAPILCPLLYPHLRHPLKHLPPRPHHLTPRPRPIWHRVRGHRAAAVCSYARCAGRRGERSGPEWAGGVESVIEWGSGAGRTCGEYGARELGCSRVGCDIELLCTRYRKKILPNTSNSDALTTTAVDSTITTIPTDIGTVSLCDVKTCPPAEDDTHLAAASGPDTS
jgi:hypothetical protein